MPEPVEKLKKPFNIFGQSRPQWTTQATTALSRMHRTIGIVWDTHKVYTMINAAINILLGFMPSAVAWVSKLLIDAVTVAISVHGTGTTTTLVIALVMTCPHSFIQQQ